MFDHANRQGCCGFSIEVLQVIRPGEDIQSLESLWIEAINPEINSSFVFSRTDRLALDNHYNLDFLKLLDGK